MTEDSRISEIRAVLAELKQAKSHERDGYSLAAKMAQIVGIVDRGPSAPRVFLPGDTVPAGLTTMCEPHIIVPGHHSPWGVATGAYVEVHGVPSPEEWHAIVDRARVSAGGHP